MHMQHKGSGQKYATEQARKCEEESYSAIGGTFDPHADCPVMGAFGEHGQDYEATYEQDPNYATTRRYKNRA